MKILVVTQYFWPENFRINDICEGLIERGHAVDVLTGLPNVPQGAFYPGYSWRSRGPREHDGIGIERAGVIARGNGSALRWILNCSSFAINTLFHLHKLKHNQYDVVFVFNNSPVTQILPAKVFAANNKIPNVIFILDIWPESMFYLLGMKETGRDTLFKKISRAVSRWLYRSGDMLLISSEGFEEKLRHLGLTAPIAYFPNYAEPLPQADSSLTREQLGLSDKDFLIGFAGNIGKAQGLDQLIAAAEHAQKPRFLLIGDGPAKRDLEKSIIQKDLSSRFVFTGWVDSKNVPGYLALCDALLVSLGDNMVLNLAVPAKLQTYMYAGKAVIAFMNGAGAELVSRAGCGVTAQAGDPLSLAAAMESISHLTPEQRQEMGARGRLYCERHFGREQILDDLCLYLRTATQQYSKNKRRKNP